VKEGRRRVVIVGGGFGGLATAQELRHADVEVTLVDRMHHHLFQPLLYQVAGGGLAAGEWRWTMTVGCLLIPLLLGVGLGDLLNGLPIGSSHEYTGDFFDLLTPYGLWTGITLVALCLLHGGVGRDYHVSRLGRRLPSRRRQSSPMWSNKVATQRRESAGSMTSSISP
jgi:hypothetical protein